MALTEAVRAGAIAEVLWHGPDGLEAATVTPLVAEEGGCVAALPVSRTPLVRRLAHAGEALVAVTDARPTRPGWESAAARCRVQVDEDRTGDRYVIGGLMGEELAKSPALRAMLDTPILRREHWWLVPRWLVFFEVEAKVAAPRRLGPRSALAVSWISGSAPGLASVDDVGWDADPVDLAGATPRLADGPGAVLTHDWVDRDRGHQRLLLRAGRLDGGRLHVARAVGAPESHRTPGLRARMRARRDLERACRAHLADLGWS